MKRCRGRTALPLKEKMAEIRFQGTDGIRGKIQLAKDCPTKNPVEAFLEYHVLTEKFFELYTYCCCLELLNTGFANYGDKVVIGWDTRDKNGIFNKSAIEGIRKAGMDVVNLKIMPTPAIALYQLFLYSPCSFVLTASHNPSDQNGIKIFLGHTGLKLFPEDDLRLTQRILNTDHKKLLKIKPVGTVTDNHQNALNVFVKYSLDKKNSWLRNNTLCRTTLIIDAANGAYIPVIRFVFDNINLGKVIYSNCDMDKGINVNSGVADLEGITKIKSDDVNSPSGAFTKYETLKLLFEEGRKQKENLKTNSLCMATVFDGDGDRFFLLTYNPYNDEVIVTSGDKSAFFQALFLKKEYPRPDSPLFINTVESDLESSRATNEIGYEAVQTAVGDKWILWQAVINEWQVRKNFFLERLNKSEFKKEIDLIDDFLSQMNRNSSFDSLKITMKLKNIEKMFFDETDEELKIEYEKYICTPGNSRFAIGEEDSGHTITHSVLSTYKGRRPVYIGNGMKSALNTLAAVNNLKPENQKDFYTWLMSPYPPGYQKSWPVYYVDKNLLQPNSEFREKLQAIFLKEIEKIWPDNKIETVYRPEEPDMVSFLVSENKHLISSVFVRNSGTEDKMSLYLRGRISDQSILNKLAESLYVFIFPRVKDMTKTMAKAERQIMGQLAENTLETEEFQLNNDFDARERLIHEMYSRQKLISKNDKKWILTEIGRSLVKSFQIS